MTTEIEPLPTGGLHLDGVILVGDIDRGARALVGLTIVFTPAGIEVRAPVPGSNTSLAWSGLDSARCSERLVLSDLQSAAVLECVSDGQSIRFLLPVETVSPGQAAYLELAVPHWLTRYRSGGSATAFADLPAPPPDRTTGVPVGAVAASGGGATLFGRVPATASAPGGPIPPAGGAPPPPPPSRQEAPPPRPEAPPPEEWIPVRDPEPSWRLAPFPPPTPDFESVNGASGPRSASGAPVPPPETWAPSGPRPTDDAGNPWAGLSTAPSAPPDDGPAANGAFAEASAGDDAAPVSRRSGRRKRRTRALWVTLAALAVAGAAVYLVAGRGGTTPGSIAADAALAQAVNLRSTDLPSTWIHSSSAASVPPLAPPAKLVAGQQTLARCLGQPVGAVQGWFGPGPFVGQVSTARSPTFGNVTVPTVQMYSTTSVLAATADSQLLVAAVASPKFGSCFGQYQVSAVALPATAQVQAVPLSGPPGVKAYGYVTTYTLPGVGNEVVGDTFIIGDRVVARLKASTSGPAIPSGVFAQAYRAVAERVARSNAG